MTSNLLTPEPNQSIFVQDAVNTTLSTETLGFALYWVFGFFI